MQDVPLDDRCQRRHCRRECELTYKGIRLCRKHWHDLCAAQEATADLRRHPVILDAVCEGLLMDVRR